MSLPTSLPHCWRISRYEPVLRARGGSFESWTDISDVGGQFNGITLSIEEYLRVEDLYVSAVIAFAVEASVDRFHVAYLGHQNNATRLSVGHQLVRSDLAPVVRGNLRGDLDCVLEAVDCGFQLAFGFDLYMYVAALADCSMALEHVERSGLYVEPGVAPAYWDEDRE